MLLVLLGLSSTGTATRRRVGLQLDEPTSRRHNIRLVDAAVSTSQSRLGLPAGLLPDTPSHLLMLSAPSRSRFALTAPRRVGTPRPLIRAKPSPARRSGRPNRRPLGSLRTPRGPKGRDRAAALAAVLEEDDMAVKFNVVDMVAGVPASLAF